MQTFRVPTYYVHTLNLCLRVLMIEINVINELNINLFDELI